MIGSEMMFSLIKLVLGHLYFLFCTLRISESLKGNNVVKVCIFNSIGSFSSNYVLLLGIMEFRKMKMNILFINMQTFISCAAEGLYICEEIYQIYIVRHLKLMLVYVCMYYEWFSGWI